MVTSRSSEIDTLTTVLELRPKLKPEPPNIYIYVYRERASERASEGERDRVITENIY